jgi:hypothetical protein
MKKVNYKIVLTWVVIISISISFAVFLLKGVRYLLKLNNLLII